MFHFTATYTDLYQLSMAQVYFNKNENQQAVFDYYFRNLPYKGGYAVFAGLEELLDIIETLRFSETDLEYLKSHDFEPSFLNYLKDFRFSGNIKSMAEGEVVFPNAPILEVEANLIEAQIIETILLNILNFQTLIATKASRIRNVAGNKTLLDFGLRRAQGPGGYYASRAAMVGGFDGSSNVVTGRDFGISISGTMAHAFVQSYDDELTAFRDFAKNRPKNCVLLVDTYDTLKSGVPNAITVAKEMEERNQKLLAIRLDSGDLAYLAKRSRKLLDDAGLNYVKIAASNQLDEYVIQSLQNQDAPIDIYGVGTNLVIGKPDGALDGVYKLAFANGKPRIKISESISKVTLPHKKQVYRVFTEDGAMVGADAVALEEEWHINRMHHPVEPFKNLVLTSLRQEQMLYPVMTSGKRVNPKKNIQEIAAFSRRQINALPDEYKRFDNPHIYKVGISTKLKEERDKLIEKHKE
ncbi:MULTISPECIES: nicotinate phosphoribosyltransferase [unclassified Leeuwenhoekiella]|uniref:nicotinate phosphoribosyltransferase n=1 Tax=unclassified Leeuwenhoekiella TaxID=2615029 RepID=UPI000C436D21|nr:MULTISPECIES: nicotinate phosphoribosyltransferase [unclassified Leeuwenhoekiella]MAW97138.1 nicotinate phosphoribosyltransferase [Leeuwenhoekiella sp.]MBA82654.1 nicotinate phosphoribosyltransferase [Leeuwenhoekiella sp.]|tara:strand:+ start:32943 stop:34343 length:1401 start_codon:yes stop_codon:yes gene_type:complete